MERKDEILDKILSVEVLDAMADWVKENTDVQVYFKKIAPVAEYAVTFSADPAEGGKVKATGYIGGQYKIFKTGETVPDGSFIDFEAVANEGYEFEKFTINGADVTPDSANPNKLSQKISGETNIVAHFKSVIPKITITYTAGEHGKFEATKVRNTCCTPSANPPGF